jgi:hypothetical protein
LEHPPCTASESVEWAVWPNVSKGLGSIKRLTALIA